MFHQESDQITRSNLLLRVVDSLLCISDLGESAGETKPSGLVKHGCYSLSVMKERPVHFQNYIHFLWRGQDGLGR